VMMSVFHLYTAYAIVPAQVLRPVAPSSCSGMPSVPAGAPLSRHRSGTGSRSPASRSPPT
jgi:hypothetical protein